MSDEFQKTLLFIDVEATGIDTEDKIIQVAYKATDDTPGVVNQLYKPDIPIKIEAMAVHHITEKMVRDRPPFTESPEYEDLKKRFARGDVFVAHNAKFDVDMIEKEGISPTNIIDTLKVARYLDPEGKIKSYALQYLRYLLDIEIEATAHDAEGDVLVLERLFYRMLEKLMSAENVSADTAIDQMIEVSKKPILYKYFPFGKYKNWSLDEVVKEDRGYLEWMLKQKTENNDEANSEEDWIYTLKYYLGH